jgi:hypothetical protein
MSNGRWADAGDRSEYFLGKCEIFNGVDSAGEIVPAHRAVRHLTPTEVVTALEEGYELRNDKNDWYSICRDGDVYERKTAELHATTPPVKMIKCACGHTIPSGSVMSASLGSSCPDCYDKMSD